MNREIKFRTWDKQNKEYAEWTNRDPFFDTSHGKIFFWERVQKEDGSYDGDIILQDFGDRFVLQQYTGLKDKNGNLIFEGDIILRTTTGYKYVVEYSDDSAAFVLKDMDGDVSFLSDYPPRYLEIIGNVMEKPELIKKDEQSI